MNKENEYLTDEELERLILEVETCELVSAPPEFENAILDRIEDQNNTEVEMKALCKQKEFFRYSIRVIASVAAAIAIVFTVPNIEPTPIEFQEVPTRSELVGKSISREEVLDDTSFLAKLVNVLNHKIGGFSNETKTEK